MDPTQRECRECPLYQWTSNSKLPEGCEYAWLVYQRIAGGSSQALGLQQLAIRALGLDELPSEDLMSLLDLMDACVQGTVDAEKIINPQPPKK